MTKQIAVRIDTEVADTLDRAVERGEFATRTDAIRSALDALARQIRDREIAEEYRRAYGEKPQEAWVGDIGLVLMGSTPTDATRRRESGRQ